MVAGEEVGKAEDGLLLGEVGLGVGFYRVCCFAGLEMRFLKSIPEILRVTTRSDNVRKREEYFRVRGSVSYMNLDMKTQPPTTTIPLPTVHFCTPHFYRSN